MMVVLETRRHTVFHKSNLSKPMHLGGFTVARYEYDAFREISILKIKILCMEIGS